MDRLGDEVSHELARVGGAPAGAMPRIVGAWPEAVGRTIARNAWPARIGRDGTLYVSTSSSSWAFELQHLEADILRRLRAVDPSAAPKKLRFAVGNLPELGLDEGDADVANRSREPGPDELRQAAELAASIGDEELRKLVAKAAAHGLVRAVSDRPD